MVVTVVVFSLIVRSADSPPPFEVMTGASLTLCTVTLTISLTVSAPRLAGDLDFVDIVAVPVAGRLEVPGAEQQRAAQSSISNSQPSAPPLM